MLTKTKVQHCKRCNKEIIVSKYALDNFDRFCDDCKVFLNNEKYAGTKDIDYVECPGCSFRSLSLEGHYRDRAKSWKKCKFTKEELIKQFGEFRIKCSKSDEKSKDTRHENGWFQDREKTIDKMSKSFLKHIDLKGKTKETSEIIRKIQETRKKHFVDGTRKLTTRILPLEILEQYKNEKGEILLSKVLTNIKISRKCLKNNIKRYNLKYKAKDSVFQEIMLKKVANLIDCNFLSEVSLKDLGLPQIKKHAYCYDGYFHDKTLLAEVHGYQHYCFPNHYHKTIEQFERQKENDKIKKQIALEHGFKYLEVSCYDSQQDIENKLHSLNLVTKEA